ncbi:MAG: Si-specific transhydrogenase, partial [Pseudomonadota bacterium]
MVSYDLIVIGSGPAGEKAAVKAAYFGKKVAVIESQRDPGGAGVNTGTLPSKTLKESALFFSGKNDAGLYGIEKKLEQKTTIDDFFYRQRLVQKTVASEVRRNFEIHKVDLIEGLASFVDANQVRVMLPGKAEVLLRGEYILIATGSYPFHPPGIPFDGEVVHDSDSILALKRIPQSLLVVGAGVIGCEYATIFGTMGCQVHLVNDRDKIMPFLDPEISNSLVEQMRQTGVEIHFKSAIKTVGKNGDKVATTLDSGKVIATDMFLFAAGRSGATSSLNCAAAGVKLGKREVVEVDAQFRTSVKNIFAVGDVIGFPALAATSMDQGRVAVSHMFGLTDLGDVTRNFPYGIYTIPEVSMVGMTEQEARDKGVDVCTGKARYSDMHRGMIMGVKDGFLKLVFERQTLQVLGVHIIGPLATEIVHFGLLLVQEKKSLNDLLATVFNYPTLHDLYKYAAYDGLGNRAG